MKRLLYIGFLVCVSAILGACCSCSGGCGSGMCGNSWADEPDGMTGNTLPPGPGYVNPIGGSCGSCVYFSSSPLITVPAIPVATPFVNTAESNPFPVPPPPRNMSAPQDLVPAPQANIYQNPEPVD